MHLCLLSSSLLAVIVSILLLHFAPFLSGRRWNPLETASQSLYSRNIDRDTRSRGPNLDSTAAAAAPANYDVKPNSVVTSIGVIAKGFLVSNVRRAAIGCIDPC
jgi:hypothetical protein